MEEEGEEEREEVEKRWGCVIEGCVVIQEVRNV